MDHGVQAGNEERNSQEVTNVNQSGKESETLMSSRRHRSKTVRRRAS